MTKPVPLMLIAAVAAAGLASGCAPVRGHQGYIIDADLVNSVQPRVDNRDSVLRTLGQPTLRGGFGESDWYYVARETRNLAFNDPKPAEQTTLRIRFDANGTVSAIDRTGLEQVASINPSGKKTPTLGRDKSFFEELFGNIGSVGAGGLPGASTGGTGP